MLAQKYRLRLNRDFQRIYQKKKVTHTTFFTLYQTSNQFKHTRFAFLVANKISKKAVERNKIKRYLRAWVQKNLTQIKSGKDVVISVKKVILKQNFTKISQELNYLFKKAKLL